jgi:hypothetical protein
MFLSVLIFGGRLNVDRAVWAGKAQLPGGDYSLSLNGSTGYVNIPASGSLNISGPITIEAWIKTNSTTTQQGIIERYDWNAFAGGYGLRLTAAGTLAFFTVENSSQYDFLESAAPVTAGAWHHVAGVYNGAQLRIFIDGALVGSQTATITPMNGTGSLRIGARGDDAAFKFNGLIDETRFTSAALYSSNFTPELRLVPLMSIHIYDRDTVAFRIVDSFEGDSARGSYTGPLTGVVRPLVDWTTEFSESKDPITEVLHPTFS